MERGREDGAARREFGELSSQDATLPEMKTGMPSIGPSEVISDYFKTIFGGIIRYSKNFFGGLLENVQKIKIRNSDS